MIDIHCHILPFRDDGASSMEAAVAMVRMAAQDGATDIVASPHANGAFRHDPDATDAQAAELEALCNGSVRIHTGCELHLSIENLEDALSKPSRYTINKKNYLLVELPDFFAPAAMDRIIRELLRAGITPIISHPERNTVLQENTGLIHRWAGMNCLTQVTAQSVTGAFGRRCRKAAASLIHAGLVYFVASDAHDAVHRPPLLSEAYRRVKKDYGPEHAETLFVDNPRATLTGAPVKRLAQVAARPGWFTRFMPGRRGGRPEGL
jgi:protein-tyrosine phosphatase